MLVLLALASCGDDGGTGGGGNGGNGGTGGAAAQCGDGKVDEGEECDGDAGDRTCLELVPELETGTPTCDASCKLDVSGCTHTPVLVDGTLENAKDCQNGKSIWVPQGGQDAVVAARLTPPSYPFIAKQIRYTLTAGIKQLNPNLVFCTPDYAHRVHVYVTTEDTPPPEPAIAFYIPVAPQNANGEEPIETTVALPEEITLSPGQHLVVGVELSSVNEGGGDISGTCILACTQGTSDPQNFWSDYEDPPFNYTLVTDAAYLFAVDGTFVD